LRACADDRDGGARRELGTELLAPRYEVIAVGDRPREYRTLEGRGRFLRGPLGCPYALDLRGDQGGHEAQHRGIWRALAGAHPQLPHRRFGDLELEGRDILGVAHQRALVGR